MERLTTDELRLLRTYAGGPRSIWDAGVLMPTVYRLAELGLIEHASGSSAWQLTSKGEGMVKS